MPDRGEFFDGKGNTAKIIAQIGTNALAATACNKFYPLEVSSTDATFGKGKWYLPAMGELLKMYGLSSGGAVTKLLGSTGADASKGKTLIDAGLTAAGGSTLSSYLCSSSELDNGSIWAMGGGTQRVGIYKDRESLLGVRCFSLLENLLKSTDTPPQIGDIMYSNKTWSSSRISSITPIGVVVDVYGSNVTIVNLNNLKFTNQTSANNFNATTPYSGESTILWSTSSYAATDISTITNYSGAMLLTEIQNYQYW